MLPSKERSIAEMMVGSYTLTKAHMILTVPLVREKQLLEDLIFNIGASSDEDISNCIDNHTRKSIYREAHARKVRKIHIMEKRIFTLREIIFSNRLAKGEQWCYKFGSSAISQLHKTTLARREKFYQARELRDYYINKFHDDNYFKPACAAITYLWSSLAVRCLHHHGVSQAIMRYNVDLGLMALDAMHAGIDRISRPVSLLFDYFRQKTQ